MSAASATRASEQKASEQRSPFREGSQFAEFQAAPLASAAQLREQQENEADPPNLPYQSSRYNLDPPNTIAPGEALLNYDEEENLPYS